MPHFLFAIIFPIHFIFHRVFPKIPITKQLYFIITKGKNRIFSKAEIFGRLSFCGFEMVNNEMIILSKRVLFNVAAWGSVFPQSVSDGAKYANQHFHCLLLLFYSQKRRTEEKFEKAACLQ